MAKIRTSDGFLVDPFNPKIADVKPLVHIHAISQINRFTGHAKHPYSVGQHTRNLCILVPVPLKKAAMVHDWAESWFNDLASPVKAEYPEYREDEDRAKSLICQVMGVTEEQLEELDWWDKNIYINERNALFERIEESGMGDERPGIPLQGNWMFQETDWRVIKHQLINFYHQLWPEHNT